MDVDTRALDEDSPNVLPSMAKDLLLTYFAINGEVSLDSAYESKTALLRGFFHTPLMAKPLRRFIDHASVQNKLYLTKYQHPGSLAELSIASE